MNTDIVVEIQNEEQFNIVRKYTDKIFERTYSYNTPFKGYGLPFCIHFHSINKGNVGCYSNRSYYQDEGATIITFEQFERDYLNVIPEDYTGRYVKALIDRPHGGSIVKGDIGLVISDENNDLVIDFPSTKGYRAIKEYVINKSRFELMPVDYKPGTELVDGQIYKVTLIERPEYQYIMRKKAGSLVIQDFIAIYGKFWQKSPFDPCIWERFTFSTPTTEEIDWFVACEREGKYIPRESISKALPKFKVGDIVNTSRKGWQFTDLEYRTAMGCVAASVHLNCKITEVKYSNYHQNFWYTLNGIPNWYSECALELAIPQETPITPVIGEWYEFAINSSRYIGRLDSIKDKTFLSEYWQSVNTSTWNNSRAGFNTIVRKLEQHEIPIMEKKEQYQFKKGDKVRCIGTNDGLNSQNYGGAGWKKNKEFIIDKIDTNLARDSSDYGVYFTHLELVKEEVLTPNPIGVKVGDWVQAYMLEIHQYYFSSYDDLRIDHDKTQKDKWSIDTYGLKVGDLLPENVITKWSQQDLNYYSYKQWRNASIPFISNRQIKRFDIIDNIPCFLVSGTDSIYLRSEGFKEFMDNFNKPKMDNLSKEDLLKEAAKRYPIGTEYKGIMLGGRVDNTSIQIAKYAPRHIEHIEVDTIEVGCHYVYYEGKWAEIISTPPVFDNKKIEEQIKILQFEIGDEIEFIVPAGSNRIPSFTSQDIPYEFIKHGNVIFKENKGLINHIHGDYFIVAFVDTENKTVQMGFKANVLRLKKKNVTQYPLTEKECYIATVDPYDKQNEVLVKLNSEVCNIKVNEPVKVTLKNTNEEVKITVNQSNQVKIKI
jgi:hypothetical protein